MRAFGQHRSLSINACDIGVRDHRMWPSMRAGRATDRAVCALC